LAYVGALHNGQVQAKLGASPEKWSPAITLAVGPLVEKEGCKMQGSQRKHTYRCWICGRPVDLEDCTTDEHGSAVHEDCYFWKVALANASAQQVRKSVHPSHHVVIYKASGQ
jgi:hypothetical protein